MPFRLTISRGAAAGTERLFDQSSIVIGRSSQCDLILEPPSTSRRHARIYRRGAAYFLEDMASSNGTKLNGHPARNAQLFNGDAISIGAAVLRFWVGSSLAEAAAPSMENSGTRVLPGADRSGQRPSTVLEHTDPAIDRPRSWRAKAAVGGAGAAIALLLLLALRTIAHRDRSAAAPEPESLGRTPIEESFGLGEEVTYPRPGGKVFNLELHAPGRALVILHFQSRDISPGEVKVTANGTEVATVPADALNIDLSHQVLIGPDRLKHGEKNRIAFERARDPSGSGRWRIWNIWAEIVMLPEMPSAQLQREANASFGRAQHKFEHRNVGAANRYLAWKDFRSSWLTLEAHPDPKPALYLLALDRLREAQQELDRLCSRLLLEIHRAAQVKDWRAARATLDQVKLYFPGNDQPCPDRAEQKRAELRL